MSFGSLDVKLVELHHSRYLGCLHMYVRLAEIMVQRLFRGLTLWNACRWRRRVDEWLHIDVLTWFFCLLYMLEYTGS